MKNLNNAVSKTFENITSAVYHRPILSIAIIAVISILLIAPVNKINLDTSNVSILQSSDPALTAYNQFRERFGTDNFIIVAIESPDIFSIEFVKKFRALHRELERNVPYLEDVTSLANIRYIKNVVNSHIVSESFLVGLSRRGVQTPEMKAAVKLRVLSSPLIKNLYVSEDGTFVTILLRTKLHKRQVSVKEALDDFDDNSSANKDYTKYFLNYDDKQKTASAVRNILKKYESDDFKPHVTGTDMIAIYMKDAMTRDIKLFVSLCLAIICGVLYYMFRRLSGVLLPVIIILLTLLSTLGIMVYAGKPIKHTSQIIPSFLLAVCVCDAVHILSLFYYKYQLNKNKKDAIIYAVGHSGFPVVLTSLTTAAGLLSFATAQLSAIVDVGVFAATGVMLGLFYSLFLLPALIAVLPIKEKTIADPSAADRRMSRLMTRISNVSRFHPKAVLLVSAVLIGLSIYFASTIRFSHDILSWFPRKNPIRIATELIDKKLKGTVNLEIVIDTHKPNGILNPDLLNRMDTAAKDMENLKVDGIFGGKAFSIAVLLKELNKGIHGNDPQFYAIPQNENAVAQEMLIFENVAKRYISSFTDTQYSLARFTIKVPFKESTRYIKFLNAVETYFSTHFPDTTISVTGVIPLLVSTSERVVKSVKESYTVAFIVITILMVLLIGNIPMGLLSMIPNLFPIIFALGIMGLFNIAIDAATMMAGSIAIGLAVDDTIHFMHVFRQYYKESGSPSQAIHDTLQTTGRAMFATSLVLSLGFFVFIFSTMNNMVHFGIITGLMIIVALLADYFIYPSMMMLLMKDKSYS